MGQRVSTLDEIGDIFFQALGNHKVKIAKEMYENLMITTPEATGALKGNWFINKGYNVGNKGFDPDRKEQPTPDVERFKNARALTLYNDSPYIVIVNNGEGGNQNNQNFIQEAMEMAKVNN